MFGKHDYDTVLHHLLQTFGVEYDYFTGIAEDMCVRHSALNALRLGYNVTVIEDATQGMNEENCALMKHVSLEHGGQYRRSHVLSSFNKL